MEKYAVQDLESQQRAELGDVQRQIDALRTRTRRRGFRLSKEASSELSQLEERQRDLVVELGDGAASS